MTWNDRLTIERMLARGYHKQTIADAIGCSLATIYNEIKRATYEHTNYDLTTETRYNPDGSQARYDRLKRLKGPRPKLEDTDQAAEIAWLIIQENYSPEAAMFRLQAEGNYQDPVRSVNTIYRAIRKGYIEGVTMENCPLHGRRKTKPQRVRAQKVSPGVSIEKRPEEIKERLTFGHWEMDSVMPGAGGKAALLVLTERKTRYEIIVKVKDHTALRVKQALDSLERSWGADFYRVFKSITVDNGVEFSDPAALAKAKRRKGNRTEIYYCHPRAPQERGSNEVQNKLIRRHYPKGSKFDGVSREDIKDLEAWINDYPRRQFGGDTARQKFAQELAGLG